jgi:hypothetical protein
MVPIAAFSRNLQSSFAMISTRRVGSSRTGRTQFTYGIRLRVDDVEPFEVAVLDQTSDQAGQADQNEQFDLGLEETAGRGSSGPGGPGGPGNTEKNRLENSASSERTMRQSYEDPNSARVESMLKIHLAHPGPPGPVAPESPLTSTNTGPRNSGSTPGPGPEPSGGGHTTPSRRREDHDQDASPRIDAQGRRRQLSHAPCPTCDVLADFGHAPNCPEATPPW